MHEEAVSPVLLELLRLLMDSKEVSGFTLGGGTSLALRFGHRKSVDLDLFTRSSFDSGQLQQWVTRRFSNPPIVNRTAGSLCTVVQGIKVDFLLHDYPVLVPDRNEQSVRYCSLEDLSAMKINAVVGRGSKKDFSDLLLLHENGYALKTSLEHFCNKYGEGGRFLAIRSLNWFQDAEEEPDPVYLKGWSWPMVKQRMMALGKELGA